MLKTRCLVLFFSIFAFASGANAQGSNMSIFLKSAAYGTAAGAVLGLATLAWSENPSSRISNVARGASLGLYAGIGFGLYTIYGPSQRNRDQDYTKLPYQIWLSPVASQEKIEGAQINFAKLTF